MWCCWVLFWAHAQSISIAFLWEWFLCSLDDTAQVTLRLRWCLARILFLFFSSSLCGRLIVWFKVTFCHSLAFWAIQKGGDDTGLVQPSFCPDAVLLRSHSWPCFTLVTDVVAWSSIMHDYAAYSRYVQSLTPCLLGDPLCSVGLMKDLWCLVFFWLIFRPTFLHFFF